MQESFISTSSNEQYGDIPEHLRDKLAHKIIQESNGITGILYLNPEYEYESDVVQFVEFLRFADLTKEIIHATSAEIREFHDKSDKSSFNSSSYQREITEYFTVASRNRASDVHFTIIDNVGAEIQFRVHGDLELYKEISFEQGNSYCRTMYGTMCDAADNSFTPGKAQSARISSQFLPEGLTGVRIATTPIDNGYIVVCRLLRDSKGDSFDLFELGYDYFQIDIFEFLMSKQAGVIMISGPTGSGKSTTLQRCISKIIKKTNGAKHVVTVEEPPEYRIFAEVDVKIPIYDESGNFNGFTERKKNKYASQIPVINIKNAKDKHEKMSNAISSCMRLDPDIIMIGEVRDEPTAIAALEAAMTGHPVYTSVHSNSAVTIFNRMFEIGIKPELMCNDEIVTGLIAQRLVKELCPHCAITLIDQEKEIDNTKLINPSTLQRLMKIFDNNLSGIKIINENGCSHCLKGAKGMTVIAEIIKTNGKLMSYAKSHDFLSLKKNWIEEGGVTMQMHGILKIKRGMCDPTLIEEATEPLKLPDEILENEVLRTSFFNLV